MRKLFFKLFSKLAGWFAPPAPKAIELPVLVAQAPAPTPELPVLAAPDPDPEPLPFLGATQPAPQGHPFSIGPTSVNVLPARAIYSAAPWTAGNSVPAGMVLKAPDGTFVQMLQPVASLPAAPDNTAVRLFKGPRGFGIVQNLGPGTVWVNYGGSAIVGSGLRLLPGGSTQISNNYQGSVSVITESSANVTALEVPSGE